MIYGDFGAVMNSVQWFIPNDFLQLECLANLARTSKDRTDPQRPSLTRPHQLIVVLQSDLKAPISNEFVAFEPIDCFAVNFWVHRFRSGVSDKNRHFDHNWQVLSEANPICQAISLKDDYRYLAANCDEYYFHANLAVVRSFRQEPLHFDSTSFTTSQEVHWFALSFSESSYCLFGCPN